MKKVNRTEKKNNRGRRKAWRIVGISTLVLLPIAIVSTLVTLYVTKGEDKNGGELPKIVNVNTPSQDDPETILIFK